MPARFIDPYRPGRSLVHQADPRLKFVLAAAFIVVAGLTPPGAWPALALLLAIALAVGILSELGLGFILRRAALALPFVLAATPLVFSVAGTPAFTFPLGPWRLSATWAGLERFAAIAIKAWASLQVAVVLAAATSFPDLMAAMRAVGLPRLLVSIFGLMWRYLFVLVDEVLRMLRARQARSGQSDRPGWKTGGSLGWRARVAGGMAGSLFLRSLERADRIYMAMAARGYDGEVRTAPLPPVSTATRLTLIAGLGLLAGLALLAFLFA